MNDSEAMAAILTQTREVQVTIVATVTVPADSHGNWLQADAVAAAAWAAREGRAIYEAHEVGATGAPGPLSADEATAWTPGKRI